MRMQNQKQANNKLKKSQILLLGSLLVFVGVCVLSYEYIIKMKDAVFADMEIKLSEGLVVPSDDDEVQEVPITDSLPEDTKTEVQQVVDYSKYLGVLEIPKIGLKRGFYNIDSRYNNIQYNVTLVQGSNMPDVQNGNLILMAHSGWASISYFEYLKVYLFVY